MKIYIPIASLIAIFSTWILVTSGFDWWYYTFMRENPIFPTLGWCAVAMGGLIPMFLPLTLYLISKKKHLEKLRNTAFVLFYSAVLGVLFSSLLKAFTGRMGPIKRKLIVPDYSKEFRFGFWEGGIFHGWPSGHTTTATTMAVSLMLLYPNTKFRIFLLFYIIYIGLGVSTAIHWYSDVSAGFLFGSFLGWIAVKSSPSLQKTLSAWLVTFRKK